ncbi:glycosyl transferase [Tepiditoga spiralis]|uniref:Glycosyl transferase n=1 Tax=Tepiditoga spiralis TaxID=2108365 RepID=A0A7G1G9Y2_9BACT|nr:glycosyltransferase family 2 protein [Tepiditoga spiralis]BBE32104.1 glycosyl transferase [Tepiditoga spiralis]
MKVAGLIVTFNRKKLLVDTINSMLEQTRRPDKIIIVNNASTDGTDEILKNYEEKNKCIEVVTLNENLGGSGGFYAGIKHIYDKQEYDWIWLMDDDALPAKNSLETLIAYYESLSEKKKRKIGVLQNKRILDRKKFDEINGKSFELTAKKRKVGTFVGYFIKTEVVGKIGFPEKDFFIYSDDVEYTNRVWKMGYRVETVIGSYIFHPVWTTQLDYILKKKELNLPLWKIYYIFRNPFLMYKNNEFVKFFLKLYFKLDMKMWKRINPETVPFAKKGLEDGLNCVYGKIVKPGQKEIKE